MAKAKQTRRVTPVSRETLMNILETLPGALFFVDDTETIIYANASAQAMIGVSPETFHGCSFWSCAPQLVSPALYQAVRKTKQTRTVIEVEYISPVTQNWLQVHLAPAVGGLTLQFHKVSAPARRQETVPRGACLSIADLNGLQTRIAILTPEGIVLDINEVPLDDAQVQREEVIGKSLPETSWWSFAPASQAQLRAAIARTSMGETVRFEARVHPREGIFRDLEATITPHIDADHHIAYLVIAGIDITARKRAEEDLHLLIDAIPQFVWVVRPDGFSEYGNQRWRDYTSMTSQQYQGDGWRQAIHPDDYQHTVTLWQHAFATGEPFESEHRLRDGRTGGYRWFLSRGMPMRDETGQIVKWFGTGTDIEDRKRIEEALRQSQQRIRALIDSNIIGIVSGEGENDIVVEANAAFFHMTGYTQQDICDRTLHGPTIIASNYEQHFQRVTRDVATHGQTIPFETEVVCKDGSRLPVLVGGVIFQERPRQIISFVLDNSARKELEQRKDDFINMASHELRNPLTALKLQITLLHKTLARQGIPAFVPALSSMEIQINKVIRLVEELLDVSKIQAGRLEYRQETVDLDALLWEIIDTMQLTHPSHRILVHGAVRANLVADHDRLGQVFTNLLSNAIKYSPDAQTVEIDLSASEEIITIRVHDHGLGIPREQREKIFERFYRATDPRQKAIPGLGMGLYIVAEIVKRHEGTITVESTVGEGSTFTVILPRNRDT